MKDIRADISAKTRISYQLNKFKLQDTFHLSVTSTSQVDVAMSEASKRLSEEGQSLNSIVSAMDSENAEPRYKNIVHLWEFLYELLASGDKCSSIIAWIREEHGEFKLKNKEEVAKRWGAYKKIKGMNYEKLSRALRHYYPKGIIKKVAGQRLVYKFNKLPYKYEPGVTRSLYHGTRIKACIQEPTKPKETNLAPPKINTSTSLSAFTPVRGYPKKSWSWPLLPAPSDPLVWYPGSTPNSPTIFDSSKTMIVFPFVPSPPVHHPLQLHFKPKRENDEPVGQMITPEVTSIPVSVIKRV